MALSDETCLSVKKLTLIFTKKLRKPIKTLTFKITYFKKTKMNQMLKNMNEFNNKQLILLFSKLIIYKINNLLNLHKKFHSFNKHHSLLF